MSFYNKTAAILHFKINIRKFNILIFVWGRVYFSADMGIKSGQKVNILWQKRGSSTKMCNR